ncbi:MAG: hypothetical protein MHM6MM_004316 [Cercozoa sp. M6MM]
MQEQQDELDALQYSFEEDDIEWHSTEPGSGEAVAFTVAIHGTPQDDGVLRDIKLRFEWPESYPSTEPVCKLEGDLNYIHPDDRARILQTASETAQISLGDWQTLGIVDAVRDLLDDITFRKDAGSLWDAIDKE